MYTEGGQRCIKHFVVVSKHRFGTFKSVRRPCQGEEIIQILQIYSIQYTRRVLGLNSPWP